MISLRAENFCKEKVTVTKAENSSFIVVNLTFIGQQYIMMVYSRPYFMDTCSCRHFDRCYRFIVFFFYPYVLQTHMVIRTTIVKFDCI